MASARDTINGALRKCGVLAAGREPRQADQQDALATLRGLYLQWINNGTFGRLREVVPVSATYTASPNERVFRKNASVVTITLPETVSGVWAWDCCRCFLSYDEEPDYPTRWNASPPPDLSVVVVHDAFTGVTVEFLYDGFVKKWMNLTSLALDEEAPLSRRDPKGLEAALATQLVDEFGGTLGEMTTRQAGVFQSTLSQRFSAPSRPIVAAYM